MDVVLSSIKERNRLIIKGMSNIYFKVTIEKNWGSEKFDFSNINNLALGQFLGSLNSLNFKNSCSGLNKSYTGFHAHKIVLDARPCM